MVTILRFTVTTKEQMASFPKASVKVYVTVVGPRLKELPENAVDTRLTARPESSVAVGSTHVTTALEAPTAAVTAWLGGQLLMTGGVLSTTWPEGQSQKKKENRQNY